MEIKTKWMAARLRGGYCSKRKEHDVQNWQKQRKAEGKCATQLSDGASHCIYEIHLQQRTGNAELLIITDT